jgi:hypothetical protein
MLSTLFLPAATFVNRNKFQALCLVVLFVAVQRLAIDFVFAQTMLIELVMPGARGKWRQALWQYFPLLRLQPTSRIILSENNR